MLLNLFNNAIQYASTIIKNSDGEEIIIKYSSKTPLFHNYQPWENKSRDTHFDVAMGFYDE